MSVRISCRMYQNRYPEVDDLVMVNVRQIAEMGAYVQLLEYDNIEGMILLSELSRRRIRSIQKLIRVGKNEVVVVLRVDKEKGESRRRFCYTFRQCRPLEPPHVQELGHHINMKKGDRCNGILFFLLPSTKIPSYVVLSMMLTCQRKMHGTQRARGLSYEAPPTRTNYLRMIPPFDFVSCL